MGVSFVAVAPEHPLVQLLLAEGTLPLPSDAVAQRAAVRSFVANTRAQSNLKAAAGGASGGSEDNKDGKVTAPSAMGVFLGVHVRHPLTGARVPVFAADYVLEDCATGAVMGVPAHDARDRSFARAFDLSVKQVIQPPPVKPVNADAKDDGEFFSITICILSSDFIFK